MAGLSVSSADINNTTGDIGRALIYHLRRAMNLKRFLDRFTSADLITNFGLTQEEADLIKSVASEFDTTNTTFQSNRTFIDRVSGLGDV